MSRPRRYSYPRAALFVLYFLPLIPTFADEQSQFDFANGLFSRGFYAEAADEYQTYIQQYPNGKDRYVVLYRLGESHSGADNFREAFEAFERLLQLQDAPDTLKERASLRQGVALYQLKEYDEALVTLDAVTRREAVADEVHSEALYYLGKLHGDAGRPESSIKAFKSLIDKFPESPLRPFARYQLAFVYLASRDLENAANTFSESASDKQADEKLRMESRFRAAEIYDQLGWFEASVEAYELLKSDFPKTNFEQRAAYGIAWALYHAGRYSEATKAATAYLAQYPDSPQRLGVAYLQGNCLQQQKRYDEAFESYLTIIKEDEESNFGLRSLYKVAWLYYLTDEKIQARETTTQFLTKAKDIPLVGDGQFLLGTLLFEDGDFEKAYQYFRGVISDFPNAEFAGEAMYKAAECLAQTKRLDESADLFETFAKQHPENPLATQAQLKAGDGYFLARDFEKAVAIYQTIVETNPVESVQEQALYRLALAQHNDGKPSESSEAFSLLLKKFPESKYHIEARIRIGDVLLREDNKPVEAMEYFEAAYEAKPDGELAGKALKGLALARLESKDYEGAATTLSQLVQAYGDVQLSPETYAWLGQHSLEKEAWDDATSAFSKLLKSAPDYPDAPLITFKLAEAYERSENPKKAMSTYSSLAASNAPGLATQARLRMAELHFEAGDIDKALPLFEEAANSNAGEAAAQARFKLGVLYEAKEDYAVAARHFMRVAILFLHEELSPEALWRAGQCFEKLGDKDDAVSTYGEVISDFPESEQAESARARIDVLAGT